MLIIPQFKSIIDFLSVTKRDISDNQVSSLNRENRRVFKKIKRLFVINESETINILNEMVGEKTLILDYVLISKEMKIIDRPYNLIFNHASRRYEPCLVILFAIIVINDQKYPINFDFWVSKNMLSEEENYLTKNKIAENMIERLLSNGLEVDKCLFDAGFCCEDIIRLLNDKQIEYTCRSPKNKSYIFESEKNTAKSLFNEEYNGNFYFYNKVGYIHKKKVSFYDEVSTLVVVANKREKLLNRDFYCLISTEKKSYTEIFRSYKERFKIEVFFRNMKNYIGLESSRTHHQDKISNHFALCIFSYIIVENLSKQLKKTFFQTLIYIQTNKRKSIEKLLYPIFNSFKSILNL